MDAVVDGVGDRRGDRVVPAGAAGGCRRREHVVARRGVEAGELVERRADVVARSGIGVVVVEADVEDLRARRELDGRPGVEGRRRPRGEVEVRIVGHRVLRRKETGGVDLEDVDVAGAEVRRGEGLGGRDGGRNGLGGDPRRETERREDQEDAREDTRCGTDSRLRNLLCGSRGRLCQEGRRFGSCRQMGLHRRAAAGLDRGRHLAGSSPLGRVRSPPGPARGSSVHEAEPVIREARNGGRESGPQHPASVRRGRRGRDPAGDRSR